MSYYGSYAKEHADQQEFERMKAQHQHQTETTERPITHSELCRLDGEAYERAHDAWNKARFASLEEKLDEKQEGQ